MSERDILYLGCERSHTWKHVGGANAGCGLYCECSVPVHQCSICGDYDYGQNPEAEQVRRMCAELGNTGERDE